MPENTDRTLSSAGQYLTFALADGHYGVTIRRVREILGLLPITAMPRTPAEVRGVLNLRGRVVPVVDLRVRLGLSAGADTPLTCIVVVDADHAGSSRPVGLVVDAVADVRHIASEAIEPPPTMGAGLDASFIEGMAKSSDQVLVLLDLDHTLGAEDLANAA